MTIGFLFLIMLIFELLSELLESYSFTTLPKYEIT